LRVTREPSTSLFWALSTSWSLAVTKGLGQNGELTPEPAAYPGYRFSRHRQLGGYKTCVIVRQNDPIDPAWAILNQAA
jgi:hypothetical protein